MKTNLKKDGSDSTKARPNRFAARIESAAPTDDTSIVRVGQMGSSTSHLHPAGTACFGEYTVKVTAETSFIGYGVTVQIVRLDGSKIIVREV